MPIVAHPPCRAWGRLRQFAKPEPGERELAIKAVWLIRENGGVLEHPAGSKLWDAMSLPRPGAKPDAWGGWAIEVPQHWFGHKAEKNTWLYVAGVDRRSIPPFPMALGGASHVIRTAKVRDSRPVLGHAAREHAPLDFAKWLVDLAGRCDLGRATRRAGTPLA